MKVCGVKSADFFVYKKCHTILIFDIGRKISNTQPQKGRVKNIFF
jgi:hypothetical protein